MSHTNNKEELVKQLRNVSDMINMGEKISWGQETTLMDKAADALETLHQELQKARESERARIEDEFARVAKYTQDHEEDGYGEVVNTSYYELYEGEWEYIIKPKDLSELDQPK